VERVAGVQKPCLAALTGDVMPARIVELHNIMPIGNIPSVLTHGILSHVEAARLEHHDVSMPAIQDRRDTVRVPQGIRLHEYANLYFHARNPMLYKRLAQVESLCILRLSVDVFDIRGTVITDQNASSKYVQFLSPSARNQLQLDQIYAGDWRHDDQIAYWRHKSQKCAEVLVPHKIAPSYILGAYVVTEETRTTLEPELLNRLLSSLSARSLENSHRAFRKLPERRRRRIIKQALTRHWLSPSNRD
jgi:hypothetical protein